MQITGHQIRAARALLGWSRQDLVDVSGISMSALLRLEGAMADSRTSTVVKVVHTLSSAGIEFINKDSASIGVLLTTTTARHPHP